MAGQPYTLIFWALAGCIIKFRQIVTYFDISPRNTTYLASALTAIFFGCLVYAIVFGTLSLTGLILELSGLTEDIEQWWWKWVASLAAIVFGPGMILYYVYHKAGGWEAATKNMQRINGANELGEAEKAEEKGEEAEGSVWPRAAATLTVSNAVLDFAFWVSEKVDGPGADEVVRPAWSTGIPLLLGAGVAVSRSKWYREKREAYQARREVFPDEKAHFIEEKVAEPEA